MRIYLIILALRSIGHKAHREPKTGLLNSKEAVQKEHTCAALKVERRSPKPPKPLYCSET